MRNFKRYSIPVKFTLLVSCFALLTSPIHAALEGEQVVGGQASFDRNGSVTTITTGTQDTTIIYDSFNIFEGEQVNIVQPNADSHTLNYVPGNQNPITVRGGLWSNGKVSLVSPGGVIFGENAIVDVGALHAAAAQIGDFDNLNDLNNISNLEGNVENYGTINAETVDLIGKNVLNAGSINASIVYLIGEKVQNTGAIYAPDGMIGMIVADEVYTSQEGSRLFVNLGAPGDPGQAEIVNTGILDAGNGDVFLGAGDVYSLAIRNSGLIQAKEITLDAGDQGLVSIEEGGVLDASGRQEGEVGGVIKVLGEKIGLFAGSRLDASGFAGGGKIFVGGGFQGKDPTLRNSQFTYVAEGATIQADALNSGNGGEVIVWADGLTRFGGFISARGGAQSGDGGFAEVSGKMALQWLDTASRDLSAVNGAVGELLLDPETITIVENVEAADINGNGTFDEVDDITSIEDLNDITDFPGVDSVISNDAIDNLLSSETGDLTLFAETRITVDAPIGSDISATGSLTFETQQLDINAEIFSSVNASFIPANPDSSTVVNVNANSSIDIFGGNASDTVTIAERISHIGSIDTGFGNDSVQFFQGSISSGGLDTGNGNDTVIVNENAVYSGDLRMGVGNDTITIESAEVSGNLETGVEFLEEGSDDDIIRITDFEGRLELLTTGVGDDTIFINGGIVGDFIFTGSGDDTIQFSSVSSLFAQFSTGVGNDTINFLGNNTLSEGDSGGFVVETGEGNDTIQFSGATVISNGVDAGPGNDTFVFLGAATLDGRINGGDGDQFTSDDTAPLESETDFDTLDFRESSLATAVDPGGESPVIVYAEGTSGTTIPDSVISGGYSNINQVLFASSPQTEVLIPPIITEEPNDTNDNDDKDLAPLIERENRLIFNRIEAPIEDALIEELAKLGIYARNNTLEETLDRFKGSAKFVQNFETERPSMADFKVAVGRTEKMQILAILEAYYELIGSEGVGPIQANLQQALERYDKDSDAMTGKGFRAYIEEHQNSELCAEALKNLNGYRKLFTKIETMGLTPRETEISKFILLRGVRRANFSHKDLYEAIRAEFEAQL